MFPNLEDELHHLCVDQAVHRLPVDVSDQITLPQTSIVCWGALFNMLEGERGAEGSGRMFKCQRSPYYIKTFSLLSIIKPV